MRYLYYCNSTYQLLTVLNLHWHRKNASFENVDDYHGDLILLNAFAGAEDIVKILNEDHVFDEARIMEKNPKMGSFRRLRSLLEIISPMFYLSSKHGFKKEEIYDRYDALVVPKYNTAVGAIWRVNKRADLHLYEDGLGTYYLNTDLLKPHSRSYRFLYERGFAKDFTHFSRLYLNAPELYSGTWKKDIRAVPKFDREYLKEVQKKRTSTGLPRRWKTMRRYALSAKFFRNWKFIGNGSCTVLIRDGRNRRAPYLIERPKNRSGR